MDYTVKTSSQLGMHLRSLRRAAGKTQSNVGSRTGISQKRLSTLELNPGRITVDQLLAIAGALDFDVVLKPRHTDALAAAAAGDGIADADATRW
ncbi:MAG: helix-turn-helix transcriptional regulator [Burkholderiales bacterium]|nr:helix-turn-helix transcriptional regulator [Burkholderiales bacterium]